MQLHNQTSDQHRVWCVFFVELSPNKCRCLRRCAVRIARTGSSLPPSREACGIGRLCPNKNFATTHPTATGLPTVNRFPVSVRFERAPFGCCGVDIRHVEKKSSWARGGPRAAVRNVPYVVRRGRSVVLKLLSEIGAKIGHFDPPTLNPGGRALPESTI